MKYFVYTLMNNFQNVYRNLKLENFKLSKRPEIYEEPKVQVEVAYQIAFCRAAKLTSEISEPICA